jgi:hypothetical protein
MAFLFVAGCASPGFPPETEVETEKVPADKRIEVGLGPGSFQVREVEFHVDKESLPVEITRRAVEEMPGGEITECEIEYHGTTKYYEVTCLVQGKEQEAMFTESGQVYQWELEVDSSSVPAVIMEQAMAACTGGELTKTEQILDGDQNPLEYHFKMTKDGVKYKVVCPMTPDQPVTVYREVRAEIEVPMTQ